MTPDFLEKIKNVFTKIPKDYYLPLGILILGGTVFLYGLIQFSVSKISRENNYQPQVFTKSSKSPANLSTGNSIFIDVEGAVLRRGVFKVSENGRIKDALIAAGGLSNDADTNWVAKNINLALKLVDGEKIYIPKIGEESTSQTSVLGTNTTNSSSTLNNGVININSASPQELDSLPGVGAVTVSKIINGRPYSAIDDLLSNKIVSTRVFDEIKDKIGVN